MFRIKWDKDGDEDKVGIKRRIYIETIPSAHWLI